MRQARPRSAGLAPRSKRPHDGKQCRHEMGGDMARCHLEEECRVELTHDFEGVVPMSRMRDAGREFEADTAAGAPAPTATGQYRHDTGASTVSALGFMRPDQVMGWMSSSR